MKVRARAARRMAARSTAGGTSSSMRNSSPTPPGVSSTSAICAVHTKCWSRELAAAYRPPLLSAAGTPRQELLTRPVALAAGQLLVRKISSSARSNTLFGSAYGTSPAQVLGFLLQLWLKVFLFKRSVSSSNGLSNRMRKGCRGRWGRRSGKARRHPAAPLQLQRAAQPCGRAHVGAARHPCRCHRPARQRR